MKEKQNSKMHYILWYTLVFVLVSVGVFLPFLMQGKGFIWTTDGRTQYFPYLHYMGNYLRDTVSGLVHGDITSRMYDFSIGMGDDINAVVRFHPLDFLSVLVPGRYTEFLYQFLVIGRIYLAGLSFSLFCLYWKRPYGNVLMGSMVYVFCGYVLKLGTEHPTFDSAMIILPLLLLATEQVLRRKSILPLAVMTCLGFLSNYYFMYICSFVMAGYVLLRFFRIYQESRFLHFWKVLGRMAAGYLLGAGLSAAVLVPAILRLGTSARLGETENGNLFLYDNVKRYYLWFLDLISPYRSTGYNTNLNYVVLVLPAIVLLFARKWREYARLKLAFFVELACLLIPAGGYVLSGFSTVGNRWVFVFSFTLSLICVWVTEDLTRLKRAQMAALAGVTAVFAIVCLFYHFGVKENVYGLAGLAELLICVALIFAAWKWKLTQKGWNMLLLVIVCSSAMVNGWFTFYESFGNTVAEYEDSGTALTYYETSPYASYGAITDDSFYRTDTGVMVSGTENAAVILGYQGISMYNSIINQNQIQYLLDQENPGINALHRLLYLDGRTASEELANVKYYMTAAGESQGVPYGYEKNDALSNDDYDLYQNQYPLSLGYTYDTWISETAYENLDALEKQQVMLKAVVRNVAEEDTGGVETVGADEILTVPVTDITCSDTVKQKESGYSVKADGGTLTISYERKAGYECYLRFVGLERDVDYCFIDIFTPDMTKSITVRDKNATYSLGISNYLVNLGYANQEEKQELTISFRKKGKYNLEQMELCYVPLQDYVTDVEQLNQEALEQVSVKKNEVSGTVNLSSDRYMVFSIPYSNGWHAFVDGKEQQLEKANVMYLGLELESGAHEIILRYTTPGSRIGLVISAVCAVILLLLVVISCRKKQKKFRNRYV